MSAGVWNVNASDDSHLYVGYLSIPGLDFWSESRAILEFDISGLSLAPGESITQVTLDVYAEAADNNIGLHGFYGDGIIDTDEFGSRVAEPLLVVHDPMLGQNSINLGTNGINFITNGIGNTYASILIEELAIDTNS